MPEDHTLLFLPDISGFTRFVERTDMEHSQHIISELIELLIKEDKLGLRVAEVEGDAVFFHSDRTAPTVDELLEQCGRMFVRFHSHLQKLVVNRICNCGACSTAERLTLKFVAHAGLVRMVEVGGRTKPFGPDVIMAHRLLKNKVAGNEYVLLTDAFVQGRPIPLSNGMIRSQEGYEEYDDLPQINYQVLDISGLHSMVEDAGGEQRPLPVMKDPIRSEIAIDASPAVVHDLLISQDSRVDWIGVNRHVCLLPAGQVEMGLKSEGHSEEDLEYLEHMLNAPLISLVYTRYRIHPTGSGTQLEATTHLLPESTFGRLMVRLADGRLKRWHTKSLERLKSLIEKEGSGAVKETRSVQPEHTINSTAP